MPRKKNVLTPEAAKAKAEKISAALTGRTKSAEHCARISEAKKGHVAGNLGLTKENSPGMLSVSEKAKTRWADPAFRERMRQKTLSYWANPANTAKMSAAAKASWEGRDDRRAIVSAAISKARKGKPLSEEHKAAIAASHAANPRTHSEETRQKISAANKGYHLTDEQRAKLSTAMKAFQASIQLQRRALSSARRRAAMDNWHRCQCSEDCTAIVKASDKMYARGHHPSSIAELHAPHDYPYWGKNGLVLMSGTWEVVYAAYLDKADTPWLYESRKFPMMLGEIKTTYTPDFYLPETDEYVELKGFYRPENRYKVRLFQQQYPSVRLHLLMLDEYNGIRACLGLPKEKKH